MICPKPCKILGKKCTPTKAVLHASTVLTFAPSAGAMRIDPLLRVNRYICHHPLFSWRRSKDFTERNFLPVKQTCPEVWLFT